MKDFNKAIMVGRLTGEPELRYTTNSKAVANFTIAVNRGKDMPADFLKVVVWEALAKIVGEYLHKGSRILLEGRLQVRNYETKDGQKRYLTEIVGSNVQMLGSPKKAGGEESVEEIDKGLAGAQGEPPEEGVPF